MAIPRKRPIDCPIEVTLSAMSARWKARIIWCLADEASSFGALRAKVTGISDRMLTVQLSELMADGVVETDVSAKNGAYRLSAMGVSLLPVLDAMKAWGTSVIEKRDERQEEWRDRRHVACAMSPEHERRQIVNSPG